MKKILVLNGPNLNMTGIRKKNVYGGETLKQINDELKLYGKARNCKMSFYQSNHEGDIIDIIHESKDEFDGVVINAGAYTHYSIAILDALKAINVPYVEVHLSDIENREEFRKQSITGMNSLKIITGLQFDSYIEGMKVLKKHLEK